MTAVTERGGGPRTAADPKRWLALAVMLSAAFLDLVDVTIVNIAVPSIQRDFGAQFSALQWITGGYALAFALLLITGGRLGDIYGRKMVFLIGIGGFTVTSALCGFAPNAEVLVVARILQGAAAGLMVPQVLSLINATFPAAERGKVFGMYGAMVGLGSVSGPMIGALLIEANLFGMDWRPVFLINLPFGILGFVFGVRFITESKAPKALRLDVIGVGLASVGLLMLLYPLVMGREMGWPVWGFVSMVASLIVFYAFVRYEQVKTRKDGSPLVVLSLFRVKSFTAGTSAQLLFGVACGIFFLMWTIYMQLGLGWSPLRAGLTGVPFSLSVAIASGLSVQVFVPRFGNRVLRAGALIVAAGTLLYSWEASHFGGAISSWQMIPPLVVMGLGIGLLLSPIMDAVLSEVPARHSGSASGLVNTAQQLGLAFGLGLVSVAFFTVVDQADPTAKSKGEIYAGAFSSGLWWVAACMVALFLLLFALPKSARTQTEAKS